ncbi:hypothetical protein [Microbacterium sp. MYb64]|uniref:hypothetical protein n=1 Tax=Microbacterium sp. MYb64 TaxID=1848691 RepID=UPI000CFD1A8E|nr:hypothetical protein [Microbacterium sp. MYb64]PRB08931.1 hypothetical protein CQ044_00755 [Microbacterium sp. MYb64]
MTENLPARDVSRRAIVKGAAWSVPVIAVAAATPLAAASETAPEANYAEVTATANPKVGTNPNFKIQGQYTDGANYVDGALKAGTLVTFTFANGATAASYSGLSGLSFVSGDPATGGPVIFQVTSTTTSQVKVTFNNVAPVGGAIIAEVLGGTGTATITA